VIASWRARARVKECDSLPVRTVGDSAGSATGHVPACLSKRSGKRTPAAGYFDPALRTVVPYVILVLVLLVKPYGLFGEERIERV